MGVVTVLQIDIQFNTSTHWGPLWFILGGWGLWCDVMWCLMLQLCVLVHRSGVKKLRGHSEVLDCPVSPSEKCVFAVPITRCYWLPMMTPSAVVTVDPHCKPARIQSVCQQASAATRVLFETRNGNPADETSPQQCRQERAEGKEGRRWMNGCVRRDEAGIHTWWAGVLTHCPTADLLMQ